MSAGLRIRLAPPRYSRSRWITQQLRCLHETRHLESGHNRWSKIKHDKAKEDATKNKQRSIFSQELATASKLFGPDPNGNPRLADLITKAKRAGFAKASIESAIARGQGKSTSGLALEAVTVEGILPGNVAVIIDCETDNRLRTLADVRLVLSKHGGSSTPSAYLFAKKGRITFEKKDGVGVDEVFEPALEAGALDVAEGDDGQVVVFTEPNETTAAGDQLSKALDLNISASEIIWDANEDTKTPLENDKSAEELVRFVEVLQDKESMVQGIYMNIAQGSVAEEAWAELQSRITA